MSSRTYIDAISAKETAMNVVPIPAKMQPYTMEAGPPLRSDSCMLAAAPVQEHSRTKEKFIVVTRLMYLFLMYHQRM